MTAGPHACQQMIYAVDEITMPVDYHPDESFFAIDLLDTEKIVIVIASCPFCGASLTEHTGSVAMPFGLELPHCGRRESKVLDLETERWGDGPPVSPPHLCSDLSEVLSEDAVPLVYCDRLREYRLAYVDPDPDDEFEDDGSGPWHVLGFCPFCGARLPASVRNEWFEYFSRRDLDPDEDPVPPAMQTGRWWREDGL